jgi:hypothetical protein
MTVFSDQVGADAGFAQCAQGGRAARVGGLVARGGVGDELVGGFEGRDAAEGADAEFGGVRDGDGAGGLVEADLLDGGERTM